MTKNGLSPFPSRLRALVFLVTAAWVLLCAIGANALPQRAFTTPDIAAVKAISSLEVAPDGSCAVYVEAAISTDGRRSEQTVWLEDLKSPGPAVRLTSENGDSGPRWSPDGTNLAFLRRVQGGRGKQLAILTLSDRKVRNLAAPGSGVTRFEWSPDGRTIAFTSPTQIEGAPEVSLEPGVHVFTRANYRSNNSYTDFRRPAQVFVVGLAGQPPRRLTNSVQATTLVGWSPDSGRVFYTVNETPEAYYGKGTSGFYEVAIQGAAVPKRLIALKDPSGKRDLASAPRFVLSPDGKMAAYVSGAPDAPGLFAQPDIFVMDLASGEVRDLTTDFDEDVGDDLAWRDNGELLFTSQKEAAENLLSIDVDSGAVTPITSGFQSVHSFSAAGGKLLAVISSPQAPAEVYDITSAKSPTQLTRVNAALRERVSLTAPESIWVTAGDGVRVQALLQKPPGFDPAKTYPMIVWNHGGPYNSWTAGFLPDVQAMAGDGYLVLYPNPRGSKGYGQAFASQLNGKWPGGPDFDDVMSVVDAVAQRPYVDKTKLGVAGSSAGGVMTDWAITHTDRFAAAVSISDIANFEQLWFIGDQPRLGADAKIPIQGYVGSRVSPINSVDKVKTPTLFISGERDYRTPSPAGGEAMFRALKRFRVPTALIRFDTAGHSIFGSEYPMHSSLRIRYLLRWMNLHLRGVPAPEFDVIPTLSDSESAASGR